MGKQTGTKGTASRLRTLSRSTPPRATASGTRSRTLVENVNMVKRMRPSGLAERPNALLVETARQQMLSAGGEAKAGGGEKPTADTSSDESSEDEAQTSKAAERARALTETSRRRLRNYLQQAMDAADHGMTLLEKMAVTRRVEERYLAEVDLFLKYADDQKAKLTTDSQIDSCLAQYFLNLFFKGEPANRGEQCLAAIMHKFPEFSRLGARRLPRAWRSMKGWRRLAPPRSRKPFPLPVWTAMAMQMAAQGHYQMATYLMVSLSGYLRPGEGYRLKRKSLVEPAPGILKHWSLLLNPEEDLMKSKTGDVDESLTLDSPYIVGLAPLFKTLAAGDGEQPLWDFTYLEYLKIFRLASAHLGLAHLVPYQLRHSGASIDRASNTRTVEEVKKRGRWKTSRSLVRYERHARLGAAYQKFSEPQRAHFARCQQLIEGVLLGQVDPIQTAKLIPI